jgi:hypothetical protein
MVLLAESFGRDVVWQWRRRRLRTAAPVDTARLVVVAGSD